ncbi:MAG: TlpA family protein disulfide reductase [candidate division Zixibacteria bacterium]|nr:TlpA family protein disulfide reductase [candidate division Zixibacteria bacterium]
MIKNGFKFAIVILIVLMVAGNLLAADKKAFEFTLNDLQNNKVSLEDLLHKGPVYIAFWATWCKPCVKELEIVNKIHDEYKDRGFIVVGINEDAGRSLSKVKSFVKAKKWSFQVLLDKNEKVKRAYKAFGLPYSVILDAEGNIIHTAYGFRPGDEAKVKEIIENHLLTTEPDSTLEKSGTN